MKFHRVGAIIMLLHDVSDPLLELAKLSNYAKISWICDSAFVAFALSFGSTRLWFYPFHVLHSVIYHTYEIVGPFGYHLMFVFMLVGLQCLHIMWYFYIIKAAVKFIRKGNVDKDERSDSDSDDERSDPSPAE